LQEAILGTGNRPSAPLPKEPYCSRASPVQMVRNPIHNNLAEISCQIYYSTWKPQTNKKTPQTNKKSGI